MDLFHPTLRWEASRAAGDSTQHSALPSSALSKCKEVGASDSQSFPLTHPLPFFQVSAQHKPGQELADGTSCSAGHRGFFQEPPGTERASVDLCQGHAQGASIM